MRRMRTGLVIAITAVGAFQFLLPRSWKMCLGQAARAPVLNDVSTDLDDPPPYIVARDAPLPESWKPKIRTAYPFLQPLLIPAPVAQPSPGDTSVTSPATAQAKAVLDAVTTVARAMPRWHIEKVVGPGGAAGAAAGPASDPLGPMLVEAVATTRVMKFKDDVIVRIRPTAGKEAAGAGPGAGAAAGTAVLRVDVRSRSRLGKGDLGANAARIREFMTKLRQELELRGVIGPDVRGPDDR